MKHNTIYPCLWFDNTAKEAADLYCTAFKDSRITAANPIVVTFDLRGQRFMALNGGPQVKPNPSISFYVVCASKEEVQQAWDTLLDGGQAMMPLGTYPWSEYYGWIQDKFGVTWQLALGKIEDVGQKFSPTLMFTGKNAGKAEEAIKLYTSLFEPGSIKGIMRYAPGEGIDEGKIKHAQFTLGNYVMMAMDSSLPHAFTFTDGISLAVVCDTQEQIDYFWDRLTDGGEESMCGWLKDRYGVSWQIVPSVLEKMMSHPDKSKAVVQAFLKMRKFDIAALEDAYASA